MATHSSILAWRNPLDRGAWRATVHTVCKRVGQALMTGQQHEVSVTPLLSTLSQPLSPFRRAVLAESTSEAQGGHVLAKGGSKQVVDLTWVPGCIIEPAVHIYRYSCRAKQGQAGLRAPRGAGPAALPVVLTSMWKWGGGREHPAYPATGPPGMWIQAPYQRWPHHRAPSPRVALTPDSNTLYERQLSTD